MAPGTRERILEIARELFTDQGYDGTSLREISDRLGFTKAALYYHFQSKEEILLALLEPVEGLIGEFLGRLEGADGLEGWADALGWVIGQMEAQMPFFRMLQRNRMAVEQLGGWLRGESEHLQMHERLERTVRSKTSSLRDQVRMIAALGAVTGFDDWAPTLLAETPMAELGAELNAAVRETLGLPSKTAADEPQSNAVATTG